jgi:hypothetical protein
VFILDLLRNTEDPEEDSDIEAFSVDDLLIDDDEYTTCMDLSQ